MSTVSSSAALSLSEVLALDGPQFLGQAYLLVLGRPIDTDGFRSYDAQLRAGASKLSILSELQASREGRQHAESVPELAMEIAKANGHVVPPGTIVQDIVQKGLYPVATHLDELLRMDDIAFIDCAYKTLLGRNPDVQGMAHYLQLIRAGSSKMRVVAGLRMSSEAKARSVALPGLSRALVLYSLSRSRFTGWFVRPIVEVEGETPVECRLRAIENRLIRMQMEREKEREHEVSLSDAAVDDVTRMLQALAQARNQ